MYVAAEIFSPNLDSLYAVQRVLEQVGYQTSRLWGKSDPCGTPAGWALAWKQSADVEAVGDEVWGVIERLGLAEEGTEVVEYEPVSEEGLQEWLKRGTPAGLDPDPLVPLHDLDLSKLPPLRKLS